ncbi:MAG TPA: SpoIIE family protein phosphatase [Rectinemataceae bacterium]|nr:SpoIIE family protein phosphatase [Rectinemataceae bacterium]
MNRETILVVEDEAFVGEEIKEDLERYGYFVPEVISSGDEVAQAIAAHKPSLIIMDVRIEGSVDGIEAAYLANAEFRVPVIYLTAYSDELSLRRAAATSPEAYLLKPFSERELVANVEIALSKRKTRDLDRLEVSASLLDVLDFAAVLTDAEGRIIKANRQALTMLEAENAQAVRGERLSRFIEKKVKGPESSPFFLRTADGSNPEVVVRLEPIILADGDSPGSIAFMERISEKERAHLLESAGMANSALLRLLPLPDAAGPGYSTGGFMLPSPSGAGDFFDAFLISDGVVAFYSLDVMGHGALATLMAYSLHDLVPNIAEGMRRPAAGRLPPPLDLVSKLNSHYNVESGESMPFFTIVFGFLDTRNGKFRLIRGGHPPVMLLPSQGGHKIYAMNGMAVGAFQSYVAEEGSGVLEPGDRLLIFSDGFLDTFEGEDYGAKIGLLGQLAEDFRLESLNAFVEAIKTRVLARRDSLRFQDDVSMLVIERRG